ncbi:4Fe-4S binding protein [Desulfotalea psychrophila]|uniref:Conserved hypothetical membrane protein n=1 Tax=Desulfotalea psychrophila (strain LSv54 / DSM 12343) TaxID=177439 RepID=Q6APX1_DESPS|nr:4Fe-4S binding protein [Desulfotalea psychrophila]CAG35602.1 conserved hypothetical membrane protein [Desulfotalea psychrophila LSv54]
MNFRKIVQGFFFSITLLAGIRFIFYISALKQGLDAGLKPGLIEGFLPISALMGLKQLLVTGEWDMIHPAGLTIFLMAIIMSAVFKKSFCSHVCPLGFVSETVSRLSRKIKLKRWQFAILASIKYLILAFFSYGILVQMNPGAIASFLHSPFNIVADARMLHFFTSPSRTTLIVLAIVLFCTLLLRNVWCRLLCPYGALLGLVSTLSPFRVRRSPQNCTGCGACSAACPNDIEVEKRGTVYSPECMGCYECVKAKTQADCLSVPLPHYDKLPLLIAGVVLGVFLLAYFGGYWDSSVTNAVYGKILLP